MGALHPLRQLEDLDERLESRSGYTGNARWMIPYADFLTILLGFFIALFAMAKLENQKLTEMAAQAQQALAAAQKQEVQVNAATPEQSEASHPVEAASAVSSVRGFDNDLLKELDTLKGQQITVSQDARGLVISLQERIFFEPGKAALTHQSEKTLDKLATVLIKTNHPIRVEGHTDNTPIRTAVFPSNWELSSIRATTIVRSLVERHHFPPERLSAAGYGEFFPLADNSTIEGKQKNRRVDIVILNPLPGLSSSVASGTIPPPSFKE